MCAREVEKETEREIESQTDRQKDRDTETERQLGPNWTRLIFFSHEKP